MEGTNQSDSTQSSLGAVCSDLSANAADLQYKLHQLNAAIDELEESTTELGARKQAESDSLATIADNLSPQSPGEKGTTSGMSAVADD